MPKESQDLREFLQVRQLSGMELSLFKDILHVETARLSVKRDIHPAFPFEMNSYSSPPPTPGSHFLFLEVRITPKFSH